MKRRNSTVEIILVAAVLALAASVAIPLSPPRLEDPAPPAPLRAAPHASAQPKSSTGLLSPSSIAELFVPPAPPVQAKPEKPQAPPKQTTKKAKNLHYVAFVVDKTGETIYVLKDTSSGAMLLLSRSHGQNGWSLVQTDKNKLILKHAGMRYEVETQ